MKIEKILRQLFLWFGVLFTVWTFTGCTGANNPLYESPAGMVNGTVLDESGNPVKNAYVQVINPVSHSTTVLTDGDGAYKIDAVPNAGNYDLVAYKNIDGVLYKVRMRNIAITGDDMLFRDLKLQPAGRIRGKVLLEGQNETSGDHSGVLIQLVGTGVKKTTGTDGSFEFEDVSYTFGDKDGWQNLGYTLTMTKQGYSVASVENIQVAAGQPTDITNVTLQSLDAALLAKIHGKISLNARDDAEGTVIRLLGTGLNRSIDVSHPDETSFSFDDIPSGSYVLQVSHADYYQKEVAFMVSAGSTDLDLGTITLENYEYFADGILATEMTLSPGSHQLAYSSKTDNEIYIVDVSGSNFNDKITNGAYAASGRGMSWSSDGGTILYVKKNPNLADRPYRLCMVSSSGGTITQFESYYQDVMQPAFAPSGSKLVYTKYEDAATYGIFEVDLVKKTSGYYLENSRLVLRVKNDQISLNQLSSVEYGLYERILYSKDLLSGNSSATDPAGIYTLPVNAMDNIDLRFRVFVNDGQNVNSATFSPTNDKIAYCVSGAGTNLDGTYVAYIDGQRTERISTAYGTSLDYDSSGKNLYLIDGRDGNVGKLVRVKIPSKWL